MTECDRNSDRKEKSNTTKPSLLSMLSRISQRLQISPSENLLKLVQQCIVDQSIRGHRFAAVQLKRSTVELGDPSARFFRHQHARRRVPRIQIELPEPVQPPASHVTQI